MQKAFAVLGGDRRAALPADDAENLMAEFLSRATKLVPSPSRAFPSARLSPLEATLLEHCRTELRLFRTGVSASSVPFLARVDAPADSLAFAHLRYLRSRGTSSPFLLLPPPLAAVIEQGYCGWRKLGPMRDKKAARERLLMEVPNTLGLVVYGERAELASRLRFVCDLQSSLNGDQGPTHSDWTALSVSGLAAEALRRLADGSIR
ncbi:MAG: hypothetical protein R3B54_13305 [Bdellovibrionota bacterium]